MPHGFSESELSTLVALLDRIIPEDDFPSASQAGCLDFIIGLASADASLLETYQAGISVLDEWSLPHRFHNLRPETQDMLLERLEPSRFGALVIRQAIEAYYAGPNSQKAWEMVGFKVTC